MATSYQEAVEKTIIASEQLNQIVNGTATAEVVVEDGSKIPSIRKALIDNFYFKDPLPWQQGQSETVFNQLRKFSDGTLWYAPTATTSNVVTMGLTPVGNPLWKVYSLDAIPKLTPQIREALRRSYAEAGYNLVAGSFETGGTLSSNTDVLLHEFSGKAYSWLGTFPKTVAPNTDPSVSGSGYVPRSDMILRQQLASASGASVIGVMPYGTVQDAIYWVTPEVFPGLTDSDKIEAAIEYAIANKCVVVAHGNYTITNEIPVRGSVEIDVSCGEFTFSGTDKIFRPIGGGRFTLKGAGKFTAASYLSNRPCVVYSDYSDGYQNLPTEVDVSDIRCFNSGIGQIAVNAEDPTSVRVSVSDNYVISDSNTDTYVSAAGITDASSVTPYLSVLGVTAVSVDISTPRKPRVLIVGNTFDVYMQSGPNADMIKVGAATLGSSLTDNGFINRNPNSACELDTFTGGLRSIVDNNDFVNCGVKLMTLQISGGPRIGLGGKSSVSNNTFTFDSNPLNDFAIFLRTSLVAISGNVFYYKGAMGSDVVNQRIFNFITAQALDNNNNGFGGSLCAGISISGNTMQMDLDPNVSRTLRMQCVNTTDMAGSTITGNAMFGGFGMVLDARPERNRNIWTGNYISSGFFTAEDVWRMNSAFVGGGNYIGSGYDNTESGIPMIPKTIPQLSNGSKIRITLDHQIRTGAASDRCLYLLHVRVTGGVKNNYATYIMSSGAHDATDRADATDLKMPVDQRLNPGNTAVSNLQSCFKAGYNSAGYIVLEAMSMYSASDQPPTKIEYAIVPLSSPFPTL